MSRSVKCGLRVRNMTSYLPLIPITCAGFCCGYSLMCLISGFVLSKILAASTVSPNLSSLRLSAVLQCLYFPQVLMKFIWISAEGALMISPWL